jgi:hypothetical protein
MWLVETLTALIWVGSTGLSVQAASAAIAATAIELRTRIQNLHEEKTYTPNAEGARGRGACDFSFEWAQTFVYFGKLSSKIFV